MKDLIEEENLHLGWNWSLHSWAFICSKHKQMSLFFQRRKGQKHNQQGPVFSVCVCVLVKRREGEWEVERSERELDQSRGCWGSVSESVWEVKPLPHSLQPTQVCRCFTFLSSDYLLQSSPDIRLLWTSGVNQQSTSGLWYFTQGVSPTYE